MKHSDEDVQDIVWGRANQNTAYFDDSTETNVTAVVGQRARLPCRVINLGGKDVSNFVYIKQIIIKILKIFIIIVSG